jgi:APA family basic amino acid/polyamine antiporter
MKPVRHARSASSPAASEAAPSGEGFARLLGTFDATMIVAGSMIGSGIFIVSADIARYAGGAGWLLAVWAATGLFTLTAALCYAELAAMFPRAGGQYVFLREAFGPLVGFLYGWTLFFVIQTGTIAAVAVAFAKFLGVLVPAVSASSALVRIGTHALSTQQAVAVGVIVLLTAANCRGVQTGKRIQNAFTVTKVASLVGLIGIALLLGWNASVVRANFGALWGEAPLGGAFFAGLGAAMVGSLFSADAWNNVTFTAAEVRDANRAVPRALLAGTGLVLALYFLTNVAYTLVLPVAGSPAGATLLERGITHAADDRVATAVMQAILGAPGAAVMALLIMISTFGCANGMVLAGPRLYYAMARDGLFFRGLARLNARAVPARGLVVQGVWTSILALSGRYGQLLDYVIATALVFYALTVIGLVRLRASRPPVPGQYRMPGYPFLPAAYVVTALAITADLLVVKPEYTWPGFAIVAAGLPAYFLWRRRAQRDGGGRAAS